MERLAFGIDFGTTNSIVAAWGNDIRSNTKPLGLFGPTVMDPPLELSDLLDLMWNRSLVIAHAKTCSLWKTALATNSSARSSAISAKTRRKNSLVGGKRKPSYAVAAEIFKHLKREAEKEWVFGKDKLVECIVTPSISKGSTVVTFDAL